MCIACRFILKCLTQVADIGFKLAPELSRIFNMQSIVADDRCYKCDGLGHYNVWMGSADHNGFQTYDMQCVTCNGTGRDQLSQIPVMQPMPPMPLMQPMSIRHGAL